MGKISIQDLAQVLVERKGLNKRDAVIFVSAMFDIIQTNLEKDRVVKVKGLGTFKIIDVDDRESVNVNTGERVLIEGHNKITFTPDALMKELVNKPFSQFETVVLNDGVDFDDTTEEDDPNDPANMPLVDFGAVKEHKLIDIADEDIPEWVIEPVVKKPKRPAETKAEPIYEPEPESIYEPEPESIDDEPFVEPEPMIEEPEPEPFVEPEPEPMIEEPEPEPFVEPEPEPIFEPEPEPIIEEPAPEPAPIVEPKHIVESKYIVEVEPEVGAEPVIEDDLVTEPEPQTFVELEPEPDLETEPVYEPTPIVKPTMIVEPEPAPKVEPIYEPEPEPVVEPEPIVEPKPAPVVEPEPEPEEDESEEEYEDEKLDEEEEIEEPSSNGGHKWLIALLTCLLGLAGGYVLGNLFPWSQFSQSQDVKVEKAVPASDLESVAEPIDSVVPADTITPAPVAVPEEKPAEAKPVEQPAAKPVEPKPAPATKPVEPKPAPAAKPEEKTEPAVQLDKYQKMDNRVRYGAYRIVGTAQEVKVKEGDNLKKIANRILGPDMECYLEVYNGMNSKTELKVGQTIKIPKLKWRKKKSQK